MANIRGIPPFLLSPVLTVCSNAGFYSCYPKANFQTMENCCKREMNVNANVQGLILQSPKNLHVNKDLNWN